MVEWKDIPGYLGYQASDEGQIRSFWSLGKFSSIQETPQRILKPQNKSGYKQVTFSRPKYHTKRVHNIVALTWLGPCPEGMEVLHGSGGKYDNSVNNLSYGTHKENQKEMAASGVIRGENNGSNILTAEQVVEIKFLLSLPENERPLQKEIASLFGIKQPTVSNIATGKLWGYLEGVI